MRKSSGLLVGGGIKGGVAEARLSATSSSTRDRASAVSGCPITDLACFNSSWAESWGGEEWSCYPAGDRSGCCPVWLSGVC